MKIGNAVTISLNVIPANDPIIQKVISPNLSSLSARNLIIPIIEFINELTIIPDKTNVTVLLLLNSLGNTNANATDINPVANAKIPTKYEFTSNKIETAAPTQAPALTPNTSGDTKLLLNVL